MSANPTLRPWTVDDFFAWQEHQDERYELVDGFPLKMMTGASNRHDIVVTNLLIGLGNRLRGKSCRPFTADSAVQTRPGQIRRPDVGVDCGPIDLDGYRASEPTAIFEVLSPSTRDFDRMRKVGEYKAMPFLRHIVLVEPTLPVLTHWSRLGGDDWIEEQVEGLGAALTLAAIGVELPLGEIYDRLDFNRSPA